MYFARYLQGRFFPVLNRIYFNVVIFFCIAIALFTLDFWKWMYDVISPYDVHMNTYFYLNDHVIMSGMGQLCITVQAKTYCLTKRIIINALMIFVLLAICVLITNSIIVKQSLSFKEKWEAHK